MSEAVKHSANLILYYSCTIIPIKKKNRKSNMKRKAHKTHIKIAKFYSWFHQGKVFLDSLKLEADSQF